ncbi:hypothetical protein Pcinc_019003 [Petrolisthes cinctipes]|uniref:Ionotropic glutamate receptor C-terminal domain-containing protein n=1 Tax=Petrolisthes cinctipes TaxID=88211 RepID=A0AAE1FN23_PETCI|nr:hypothetical protein Pcinc_019003 [Petrolisthes cinctipes]
MEPVLKVLPRVPRRYHSYVVVGFQMDCTIIVWFVNVIMSYPWMISGIDYLTITSLNVTNQQLLADPFLATTPEKGKIGKTHSEYLINDVKHLGNIGSASGRSSDASSLSGLLVTMVQEELSDCRLVLVYDASDLYSVVVKELLMLLPNHPKQRSCFMVKMEEPLPRWHALAYPYHPWSWLAILVGFILSGLVLFLLATASSQCGDETTSLAKLGYSWGYSSGCHFQEPQTAEPRMDSTRIFVLFLWLYTMILSIVYSTNLTAFLLVTKTPTSIQTMEELYQSGREVASIGMTGEYGGGDLTDSGEAGQVAAETGTVLAFNMDHMQGAFMVAAIGWYMFVSQRVEQVEALVATRNGKKTEHILGVVKKLLERYKGYSSVKESLAGVMERESVLWLSKSYLNFHIVTRYTVRGEPQARILKARQEAKTLTPADTDHLSQGSCFMARVEPPLPRWQALAFPFHPWTWLAILVGVILSGPILFLLAAASGYCGRWARHEAELPPPPPAEGSWVSYLCCITLVKLPCWLLSPTCVR